MSRGLFIGVLILLAGCTRAAEPCLLLEHVGHAYTVCTVSARADIRLFLYRETGKPLYSFEAVEGKLAKEGAGLVFAMNAGMYHEDRAPVGLYVEAGTEIASLNTASRYGNFGLVPNGVFFIVDGQAGIVETNAFLAAGRDVDYATQSGPMLVIDGALHPKFNAEGASQKKRNGVGVSADGDTVYFVISEQPVNFHSFATLFRDQLQTPNALFLDGTVSRLYDPDHDRNDPGLPMGPIVGVVTSD